MVAALSVRQPAVALDALHARFLSILGRIRTHARIVFRCVKCPQKKADLIAETVALAWSWFQRLAERGKDATQFPAALASLAAKAVKSGRKVAGMAKAKDAMNELTQQRRGFVVGKLPDQSTLTNNPLSDALIDNTQTPPDEQAMFRLDFSSWLASLAERDQRLATDMGLGERTLDLARRYGLSPARISQKRGLFKQDWQCFCEPVDAT